MKKLILLSIISIMLVGCSGTTPAVNANSNKTRFLTLSVFEVKSITYNSSFNNNGTATNVKD